MKINVGDLFTIKKVDAKTRFLTVGQLVKSTMDLPDAKPNTGVTVDRLNGSIKHTTLANVLASQLEPYKGEETNGN
jgi:hypothetical protein